jgi:hypothetical protein
MSVERLEGGIAAWQLRHAAPDVMLVDGPVAPPAPELPSSDTVAVAEREALAAVDHRLAELAAERARLTDQLERRQKALADLQDEMRVVARLVSLHGGEHEQAYARLRQRHADLVGIVECDEATLRQNAEERSDIEDQRSTAEQILHEAELQAAADAELAAGEELAVLADAFAARLQAFIALDNNATRLATLCKEPQGRHLADRLTCALSAHLIPVLTQVAGIRTSITLDVTSARMRNSFSSTGTMGFAAIARRPFTRSGTEEQEQSIGK